MVMASPLCAAIKNCRPSPHHKPSLFIHRRTSSFLHFPPSFHRLYLYLAYSSQRQPLSISISSLPR